MLEKGKEMEKILQKLKDADLREYRSLPFWSWNDRLDKDELIKQTEWMKKQGFGGFFMHARSGLTTEYLGEEWFECIKACIQAGKQLDMECWAYDENGWPSGFAGGELLKDENDRDRYLTYSVGEYDEKALVSYCLSGEKLVRAAGQREKYHGDYLNVYEHVAASTADVLNTRVTDKFIALTHEKYKKECGDDFSVLKGFFTDEPQYQRWAHPYTRILPEYFAETYGQDILDGLGLLFVEKEGYRDFRYKYWLAMQTLLLNSFSKKIYNWCEKNGVMLTGHYIEETSLGYQMVCCGGIMPFYEYEHIPGIDKLGRESGSPVAPKQVSSVARQLGKKRVITETFGCCGWDATPRELKLIADCQYANGVNLMCQHLLPYSEHGQRKRDYPAHFSWANPWVRKDFKTFNDYYARLGYLLGESEEIVSVALFCPVRSMYFDYKRENFEKQQNPVDESYIELCGRLSAMNVPYHILDETVMEKHACVRNGKLVVGECSYDTVVFPKTLTMGKFTARLMEDFALGGGRLVFTDGLPQYLEGEPHTYSFKSNAKLCDVAASQPYTVSRYDTGVQSTLRRFNGKEFIFAVNTGDGEAKLRFEGDFKSFDALDIESMTYRNLPSEVVFGAGESYVLFFSDETEKPEDKKRHIALEGEFKVVSHTGNYLTLDRLRYSTDGVNFSDEIGYMGVFNQLLESRYSGKVFLKYRFKAAFIPGSLKLLCEDMNNVCCTVNGHKVTFDGVSDFEKQIYTAEIAPFSIIGENEITVEINFYESENVYYALFGENVTESLKNCLAYDTTVEACYLQGDFGVFSDHEFKDGKEKNVLICDGDFYIDKPKKYISDTVKDGFPFFAGTIVLEKKFITDKGPCVLDLDGRFHLCDVTVNGKTAPKSYFGTSVDIGDLLVKGENTAVISLCSGNRNLLGPHHLKEREEPFSVGPETFELTGTWTDGKSSMERESYSFVKFGLFGK